MKSFAVIALLLAASADAKSRGMDNVNEVSMMLTMKVSKSQRQEK